MDFNNRLIRLSVYFKRILVICRNIPCFICKSEHHFLADRRSCCPDNSMGKRRNFHGLPGTIRTFRFILDFFERRIVIRFKSHQNRTVHLIAFTRKDKRHLRSLRIFIECPICRAFLSKHINCMYTHNNNAVRIIFQRNFLRELSGRKRLRFGISNRVCYRL